MAMTRLAVDGGEPVRGRMLPYGRQSVTEEDIASVVDVLRSDWLTTGPTVAAFEDAFAAAVGARNAVAVSSGTAALHAAAAACGIGPGDEVIVPAMTFAASANCVRYLGGTVVFADVNQEFLASDAESIEPLITPRTKAIVVVDYAGHPADLAEIGDLAKRYHLALIEDASHALGATYRGRTVGQLADYTVFSFHPVKHITTGEGGAVTTNDPAAACRLRQFRNHGITSDVRDRERAGSWAYEMVSLGYNYRLTDIQSALGLSQLRRLPESIARRTSIANRYNKAFAALPTVETPTTLADRTSAWHLYVLRLHLDRLSADRRAIYAALRAENIGVNVHYIPVPWHPYYQGLGYERGGWPVAEANYERMLTLPIFPAMSDGDVRDVQVATEKVLIHFAR
jgi:perosamine synthetase